MATKVISQINETINDDWLAIDANDNSFLGVSITQNSYGVEIYGIDFGARGAAGDEDFLRTSCIIAENFILDPSVASIFIRTRMRNQRVRFFDLPTNVEKSRVHAFTFPIKINAGVPFSVMFNTFQNGGAIAGVATVYLTVHGIVLDKPKDSILRS